MTNNDILRRIRYLFDLNDSKMIKVFGLAETEVSREDVCDWLKRDDDASFRSLTDKELATFLNGFITLKRGPKEGDAPIPEDRITNNIIFQKLKIALNLQSDDIIEVLQSVNFKLSKHELSAFFRKPGHKHFRVCKDQLLRNFLNGLQLKFKGEDDAEFMRATSSKSPD